MNGIISSLGFLVSVLNLGNSAEPIDVSSMVHAAKWVQRDLSTQIQVLDPPIVSETVVKIERGSTLELRAAREALLDSMIANSVSKEEPEVPATPSDPIPYVPESEPFVYTVKTPERKKVSNENECDILPGHVFFNPTAVNPSQVCPKSTEWLTQETPKLKSNKQKFGWVRVKGEQHLPVITRHPAANGHPTLLLDASAIISVGLTRGVRMISGMGMIAGQLPENYIADFLGRGEEPETFEMNGRRYFIILNAEPGAGVLQLSPDPKKKKQTEGLLTASVFAPVLADTITFLDLEKPEPKEIRVQVVKSGEKKDPDVSNLTVSLSTYRGIQAITQSQGYAVIRNVPVVPGFPTFVDVSSRSGDQDGYSYRFELRNRDRNGVYWLYQLTNGTGQKWFQQVRDGLSDQAGVVLGLFSRKNIDGFKNFYYPKVKPLGDRIGLNPLTYTVAWNGRLIPGEPLEGDLPRWISVQVPEGLSSVEVVNEDGEPIYSTWVPVSPRVINVVSE